MSKRKHEDTGDDASRRRGGRPATGSLAVLRDRSANQQREAAPASSSAPSVAAALLPASSSSAAAAAASCSVEPRRQPSRRGDARAPAVRSSKVAVRDVPTAAAPSAAAAQYADDGSQRKASIMDASMVNVSLATIEGDAVMMSDGGLKSPLLCDMSIVCAPSPAVPPPAAIAPYDWDEAYQAAIMAHQRKLERSSLTRRYLDDQPSINARMRAILADWLVEVCSKYKQQPETFFRTLHLIDQYLSVAIVQRQKLQLVGVTALLISSKFEEVCGRDVTVAHMVHICAGTYTSREVIDMERAMLAAVGYIVSQPTPYTFLPRFLATVALKRPAAAAAVEQPPPRSESAAVGAGAAAAEVGVASALAGVAADPAAALSHLASYFLELAATDYDCLLYLPSQLTAAAVALATCCLTGVDGNDADAAALVHASFPPAQAASTRWSVAELADPVGWLEMVVVRAAERVQVDALQAVRRKYEGPRCGSVAYLPLRHLEPALRAATRAAVEGMWREAGRGEAATR